MPIKVNGLTSGSVTLAAPDTGSDETLTLPGVSGELLPLAGGKILQVVRATDSTNRSTTSTSLVDADLSVTITPQKNNSAVLLIASVRLATVWATGDEGRALITITDSSNAGINGAQDQIFGTENLTGTGTRSTTSAVSLIAYATPSTTSAVTYKMRFAVLNANTTVSLVNANNTGQMYAIEVSA